MYARSLCSRSAAAGGSGGRGEGGVCVRVCVRVRFKYVVVVVVVEGREKKVFIGAKAYDMAFYLAFSAHAPRCYVDGAMTRTSVCFITCIIYYDKVDQIVELYSVCSPPRDNNVG